MSAGPLRYLTESFRNNAMPYSRSENGQIQYKTSPPLPKPLKQNKKKSNPVMHYWQSTLESDFKGRRFWLNVYELLHNLTASLWCYRDWNCTKHTVTKTVPAGLPNSSTWGIYHRCNCIQCDERVESKTLLYFSVSSYSFELLRTFWSKSPQNTYLLMNQGVLSTGQRIRKHMDSDSY